ncbi:hypothetical protein MHYP_G00064990 [Metynnis hypsauchen]
MPSVSLSLPAALAGRARTWVCLSCMFWTRGPDAKAVWKVHDEFGTRLLHFHLWSDGPPLPKIQVSYHPDQ